MGKFNAALVAEGLTAYAIERQNGWERRQRKNAPTWMDRQRFWPFLLRQFPYHRFCFRNIISCTKLCLTFLFPVPGDHTHFKRQPVLNTHLFHAWKRTQAMYHSTQQVKFLCLSYIIIDIISTEELIAAVS